jgi:hypothetical protein
MFKGLGMETFSYSGGTTSSSNGWSYNIKAAFDNQLALQPQYRGLTNIYLTSGTPEGSYYLANMAIGLADDDYRSKFGVIQGTNLSEFGQWVDSNRQAIWNDAAGWFLAVPYTSTAGGNETPPSNGNGGNGGSLPDAGFFGDIKMLAIIGAIALGVLLLVKR